MGKELIRTGWVTKKDLFILMGMVVLSFIIENTLGLILLVTGIPLAGGLISAVFDAALIFLGIFLVPRKLAAFFFAFGLLLFSVITPSFGPPGFYKLLIGIMLGGITEIFLVFLGRKAWAYIVTVAIVFGLSIPITYFAWLLCGIPNLETLKKQMLWLIPAYVFLGAVGASIGATVYYKTLSKFRLIRDLRTIDNSEQAPSTEE